MDDEKWDEIRSEIFHAIRSVQTAIGHLEKVSDVLKAHGYDHLPIVQINRCTTALWSTINFKGRNSYNLNSLMDYIERLARIDHE